MAQFEDYSAFVIYRCLIGSRAYGLATEQSDTDRRGIFLPPAERQWSLAGVPEQIEREETQECYWELQKFLTLALKANPHVLECLYTPIVELATPIAQELLGMRSLLLSKRIYGTFNGYAEAQFRKLMHKSAAGEPIKWKMVMHLIRLLLAGKAALATGELPVRVDKHRELLLAIRQGELAWDEVDTLRRRLHIELREAFDRTALPDEPDFVAADAFLIQARRSMVSE